MCKPVHSTHRCLSVFRAVLYNNALRDSTQAPAVTSSAVLGLAIDSAPPKYIRPMIRLKQSASSPDRRLPHDRQMTTCLRQNFVACDVTQYVQLTHCSGKPVPVRSFSQSGNPTWNGTEVFVRISVPRPPLGRYNSSCRLSHWRAKSDGVMRTKTSV